jgi:Carboxypeptidase regulatory-like domain
MFTARKALIAAAASVALVAAALALPAPAFAAGTGSLTVQLASTKDEALKLGNESIYLYYKHDDGYPYAHTLETGTFGNVTFSGVPSGVDLTIKTFANSQGYVATTVHDVKIAANVTTSKTVEIALGATVSGQVKAPNSQGLYEAWVAVLDSDNHVVESAETDTSGNYEITTIPTGTYRVQFNSRRANPSPGNLEYGWSYWKNSTSFTGSKTISVKQQTSSKSATELENITGTVPQGSLLTVSVQLTGENSGDFDGALIDFVGTHGADSFEQNINSTGTSFETYLDPGKYRIGIFGPLNPVLAQYPLYWYVGDTDGPTQSESHATWVTIGSTSKTITFVNANPIAF